MCKISHFYHNVHKKKLLSRSTIILIYVHVHTYHIPYTTVVSSQQTQQHSQDQIFNITFNVLHGTFLYVVAKVSVCLIMVHPVELSVSHKILHERVVLHLKLY